MKTQKFRSRPNFEIERDILEQGFFPIAGVDEAGRGPWAGPVVAAAVILNTSNIPDGIDDSKALNEHQRDHVYDQILESGALHALGIAEVDRIDRENILKATLWAMQQAVEKLPQSPLFILIDGNTTPDVKCRAQAVVRGDSKCLSIAAASIIAKVTRDRIMSQFDDQYPGYGFANHKGYGTPEHKAALIRLGISPIHRQSFKPIRMLCQHSTKS